MNNKIALALDFDGLIADGADECILISWNAHFKKAIEAFSDTGLAEIPSEFKSLFLNHRSFAKHLGHFFMPFKHTEHFETQEQFDSAYAQLDPILIEDFISSATKYRSLARETYRQRWLDYHSFYKGVVNLLKNSPHPIYIVTAKDSESVQELLKNEGITLPNGRIYGERRKKNEALSDICETLGIPNKLLHFYDDNILNAIDAYNAGYGAFWAIWGYNANEHFELAKATKLPQIALDYFANKYFSEKLENSSDEVFA